MIRRSRDKFRRAAPRVLVDWPAEHCASFLSYSWHIFFILTTMFEIVGRGYRVHERRDRRVIPCVMHAW